jgi:hypothetical protein
MGHRRSPFRFLTLFDGNALRVVINSDIQIVERLAVPASPGQALYVVSFSGNMIIQSRRAICAWE